MVEGSFSFAVTPAAAAELLDSSDVEVVDWVVWGVESSTVARAAMDSGLDILEVVSFVLAWLVDLFGRRGLRAERLIADRLAFDEYDLVAAEISVVAGLAKACDVK